ncbi:hypothetical protein BpHYR1_035545 [Brachionus plicatilis]|uniref:Uncharacterized protein n=1 Tax=Brachionus plicatilis TaxID=10195 RepID=A0A3M7RJK8_BRAPC|nr:hypothetical protein BpHYR1_035545 [Brachionus plicatilis]
MKNGNTSREQSLSGLVGWVNFGSSITETTLAPRIKKQLDKKLKFGWSSFMRIRHSIQYTI